MSRLYEKLSSICMSMVCCYFHEFFLNISFLNFFRFLAYSIYIDFQIKNEKVRKQYKIGCLSYGIMFQGGTCNCKGSIGFFLLNKNLKKKKKKTLCLIYSSQLEHSFISFSIHFKEKKIIIFSSSNYIYQFSQVPAGEGGIHANVEMFLARVLYKEQHPVSTLMSALELQPPYICHTSFIQQHQLQETMYKIVMFFFLVSLPGTVSNGLIDARQSEIVT